MKAKKQIPPREDASLKHRLSELSELPKDVVLGIPMLTMVGQMELNIENYRGIIEYTDCLIRVHTKDGQIRICGKNLKVDYYTNDEMKVTGHIISIEYVGSTVPK